MNSETQGRGLPDIIPFWFGNLLATRPFSTECTEFQRWYGKDLKIDAEIRTDFGALHQRLVMQGLAEADAKSSDNGLAQIIVIDQMSRNMFRDTPRMYAYDGLGLMLSRRFLETPGYREMDLFRQMFAALPLMHSEQLADQDEMLVEFDRFAKDAADLPTSDFFVDAQRFARRHHEIIARFGRFPHRNSILERVSTDEECSFLEEADSSF